MSCTSFILVLLVLRPDVPRRDTATACAGLPSSPMAHCLSLLRILMLKGANPRTLASHVTALLALAAVSGVVSFRRFHTTLQYLQLPTST